jgi:hypothetical protein
MTNGLIWGGGCELENEWPGLAATTLVIKGCWQREMFMIMCSPLRLVISTLVQRAY